MWLGGHMTHSLRMAKSKKPSTSHSKSKKVEVINPFEVKTNRQKHDILGRKITKHEVGKPFQSRKKAVEKRKKTLLVEYSNLGKVNSIVDRRTGEYDKSLSSEQKKLKRFARVRKFNLVDSDEEEFGPEETLTHFGQSVADADGNWSDDSDDDGRLGGDIVAMEHFSSGGGLQEEGEGEGKHQTHQDRLKEQIQKKNLERFNRDKQKDELQTQRVEIDSQFTEYMSLLKKFQEGAKERSEKEEEERGKTSSFSMTRKSLLFERRGTPAERLKTPEQLAKEEKERLEKLEAERLQRMNGSMSEEATLSADALTTNTADALDVYSRQGRKRLRNSAENDSENEGKEKEEEDDDEEEEEDDDDRESEDENEDSDDDEEDDVEEENDDLESDDEEEEGSIAVEEGDQKDTEDKKDSKDEESQFETKLSTYCEMLANSSNLPTLKAIDEMTQELVGLAQKSPSTAGQTMNEMIGRLCNITQKSMPGLETLLFLRLAGLIFPPSDRRHPVTTPAMLLISKLLNQGIIRNCRDVASGLFLSTLFLEFVSLSKRFVPEAINFLSGVLFLAASKPSDKEQFVSLQFKSSGNCNPIKLVNRITSSSEAVGLPLNIQRIYTDQKFMESDDLRIQCLIVCLELVKRFRTLYRSLPAVEAIFLPIKCFVEKLHLDHYPQEVRVLCNDVVKILSEKVVYCPLVKTTKKPVPMKQLEPKVDEKFDGRKKLVGSREWKLNKIEVQKSKKLKKDAERELRKDHRVLQAHIVQQSLKKKKIKDQKVKEIMSSLATQEGEWRSMKKGKKTEF